MSKIRFTTFGAITCAILMTSALADTVTLKNGEHIEGKIVGETDKEVTLEVKKAQQARGDIIGALNAFVLLEKSYPGSASMPEAIELAQQLVASLKPAVERAIPTQKILKADREKGFVAAGPLNGPELKA